MSQSVRQNNLFAAEDWEAIYRSFQDVSFQSYDFETIRDSLVDYIRANYPENFNDYIESSEFIAVIELLAWTAASLAFRVDLNARENFLDTAERRESIVRLARMLNYQPKRNIPATGLVKLTAVETNEPVTDSLGRNIGRNRVFWNDPNNPDSFEQFIAVLNAAFTPTNPFGRPQKSGTIGNIPTDLYRLENAGFSDISYNINTTLRQTAVPFDIVNVDFRDGETFFERHPNPDNPFHLIYRRDGEGQGSPNTGFFLHFRQGVLDSTDFSFDTPVNNRVQDVDVTNINETDVYVQQINQDGDVIDEWTRVPSLVGNNVIYNSVNARLRNIYTVIPRLNDEITLRFSDGNFGNVPTGIFRVWYRTSLNRNIVVRPEEFQNAEIRVPYTGRDGQRYTLTMVFSLEETVSNSAPTETDAEIKQRAPRVFYTQNRMVNGEDYNVFPLTRGNDLLKIKAINRTHAGHSRFIDINDPTGTIQNTLLFGEDGALWADTEPQLLQVSTDVEIDDIANISLTEFIRNQFLQNFFYSIYLEEYRKRFQVYVNQDQTAGIQDPFSLSRFVNTGSIEDLIWVTDPERVRGDRGFISVTPNLEGAQDAELFQDPDNFTVNPLRFLRAGCKLKFVPSDQADYARPGDDVLAPEAQQWVTVRSVTRTQIPGENRFYSALELSETVERGWVATEILPAFRRTFTEAELLLLTSLESPVGQLTLNSAFGLGYDIDRDRWFVILGTQGDEEFQLVMQPQAGTLPSLELSSSTPGVLGSWLVYAKNNPAEANWTFSTRGRRYIFESADEARFYFDENFRLQDVQKGRSFRDTIELLSCNTRLDPLLPIIPEAPRGEAVGTHTGGTATVTQGESAVISGRLSVEIDAPLPQPPYTAIWEYVSGERLDQEDANGQIIIENIQGTQASLDVSVTRDSVALGTENITSQYGLVVYEGTPEDNKPLSVSGDLTGEYVAIGTDLPVFDLLVTGCTSQGQWDTTGECSGIFRIGRPNVSVSGGVNPQIDSITLNSVTPPGGVTILSQNFSGSIVTGTWSVPEGSTGRGAFRASFTVTASDPGNPAASRTLPNVVCQSDDLVWNCAEEETPTPPPQPDTPATVSFSHTGGSCNTTPGSPCVASGEFSASLSDPDGQLTAPYTFTFSRRSGATLSPGSGASFTVNTSNRTVNVPTQLSVTSPGGGGTNTESATYFVTVSGSNSVGVNSSDDSANYRATSTVAPSNPPTITVGNCVDNSQLSSTECSGTVEIRVPNYTIDNTGTGLTESVTLDGTSVDQADVSIDNVTFDAAAGIASIDWSATDFQGPAVFTADYTITASDSNGGPVSESASCGRTVNIDCAPPEPVTITFSGCPGSQDPNFPAPGGPVGVPCGGPFAASIFISIGPPGGTPSPDRITYTVTGGNGNFNTIVTVDQETGSVDSDGRTNTSNVSVSQGGAGGNVQNQIRVNQVGGGNLWSVATASVGARFTVTVRDAASLAVLAEESITCVRWVRWTCGTPIQ